MSRNLEAAQILAKARDVIHERGWTQGHLHDRTTGAVCAIGALDFACGLRDERHQIAPDVSDDEAARLIDLESDAITALWRQVNRDSQAWGSVPDWNDHPSRTVEDVLLAMKQAQHLLETQEVSA